MLAPSLLGPASGLLLRNLLEVTIVEMHSNSGVSGF